MHFKTIIHKPYWMDEPICFVKWFDTLLIIRPILATADTSTRQESFFKRFIHDVFFLSSWCSVLPTARRYTADNCTHSISMCMIFLRFLFYFISIFFSLFSVSLTQSIHTSAVKLQLCSSYIPILSYAIIHINAPCTYTYI